MNAKTLLQAMIYPVDIVEVYTADFQHITTCTINDFEDNYSDNIVDKFNIYESNDGSVVLEIFIK